MAQGRATARSPTLGILTAIDVRFIEWIHTVLIATSDPQYYHVSSRTGRMYRGDRHPEEAQDEELEATARACGNCGEVVRCMRKEFL